MKPQLDLVFRNETKNSAIRQEFLKNITEIALKELGFKRENVELSINLVGNKTIQELNSKYRGEDKATDVLSFPLNDRIGGNMQSSGIMNLGDIFISLPFVMRGAGRNPKRLKKRVSLLLIHGLLHLLGYEHNGLKSEKGKKDNMILMQDRILEKAYKEI